MSLTINRGYKSLNLYFTQPANAYYIDDISTDGTQQLQDTSLRTDVEKLYVWVGTTSNFSVDNTSIALAGKKLVYSGNFQSNLIIDSINISNTLVADLKPLADNTTYYIKYAITSKLDPSLIVVSDAVEAKTLDTSLEIQGWLTRDPIEIEANPDGTITGSFPTTYTGVFTVYRYSENITTSANTLVYSIGDATGGVTATINTTNGSEDKGKYTITGMSDLVGTITLKATYTDPLSPSRIIEIEKILNVSKRRPGATASIVELSGNGIAFVKVANSTAIAPANRTLTATATNVTSPIYKWYLVGATSQEITFSGTTQGSTSLPPFAGIFTRGTDLNEIIVNNNLFQNETTPSTKTIRVEVTTNTNPGFQVSDVFTYYYVQEGSDALTLGLENENQNVFFTGKTAESVILNSAVPITTKLTLAKGSNVINPAETDITSPNHKTANNISNIVFAIASSTGLASSAITLDATTGAISISRNTTNFPPDSFLSAEIVFKATVTYIGSSTSTVLTRKLIINAAFDGQSGSAYWLVNTPNLLIKQKSGTLSASEISWTAKQSVGGAVANYTAGYFNVYVYKNNTLNPLQAANYSINSGTVTIPASGSSYVLDASADYYRVKLYSDSAKTILLDEDDIQIYEEGSDGIIVFNDNKMHTVSRDSEGNISSYIGTGTYFNVQQGTQLFTADLVSISYSYNSVQKKLVTTKTLSAGQYRIKSIVFGSGIIVNTSTTWSSKFSIRNGTTTDLIFEDWLGALTLDSTTLQSSIEFEIEYKRLDGTLGTQISTQKINVVRDSSTVIVDVENDSHQIPFTTANVGIYLYSGTKIQAFDSNRELQYRASNATLANGEWKITSAVGVGITASGIPVSAPTVSGTLQKYVEFTDHSNLLTDTARIDYIITAKTYRGVEVSGILAGQTFTKVKNATALYRITGATNIIKFNNGTFSSLSLTAQKAEGGTVENFTTGYFTSQIKNSSGTLVGSETARTQTDSFTVSPTQNTDAKSVVVKLYRDASGGPLLDTSELLVVPQAQDGQDGNLSPWLIVTSNYTASAGERIIADTKTAYDNNTTFTINLPASPNIGTSVIITDGWNFAQKNLIVGRNGSKIVNAQGIGETNDINLDVQNTTYEFIYTGATRGWDFTATAGPKGDDGIDASILVLEATDTAFVYPGSDASLPTSPNSIVITATKQNVSGVVSFTVQAYDATNFNLGNVTYTRVADTITITADNFNNIASPRNTVRYVKVTASLNIDNSTEVLTDNITINRLDNGSDTIVHQMSNESHIIAASTLGVVTLPAQGALTTGIIYRGSINETMNWNISTVNSTGFTTTFDPPHLRKISNSGTIGNISSVGTNIWQATITGLSSTTSVSTNDTISAVEDSDGRLFTGKPTSVLVFSKTATSITYRVTGGGAPVAGPIGGLAKGLNSYVLTATGLTENTGTSTVTATKNTLQAPEKIFSLAKSKDGTVFLILDLSNENETVATNNDGSNGNYSLATSIVTASVGNINVLPTATSIILEPSAGVSYTYTKNGITSSVFTDTIQTVPSSPEINSLSIAITNLTQDNGRLRVKLTYLSVEYISDFTVTKAKVGPNGEPAVIFSIFADSEIQYDSNTKTFSPALVEVSAYRTSGTSVRQAISETGYVIRFEKSTNKTTWQSIGTDTNATSPRTLTTSSLVNADPNSPSRYFRYSLIKTAGTVILDSEIDVIGQDGVNSSVVSVDVENDTHQIPFTTGGTGTYTFSGTKIHVYENTTELIYTQNSNPSAGYWTFTNVQGSSITPSFTIANKPSTGNLYAEVNDHSNMTGNTAIITYTIKATTSKGITVDNIQDVQTFTKFIGNAIYRIVGAVPITKSKSGVFSSVTVKAQKIEEGVTSDTGVLTQQHTGLAETTNRQNSITIQPTTNSNVTSVIVRLYASATSTTVLDTAELKVVQDGLDGSSLAVQLTNDTHDIPFSSDGQTGYFFFSGTDIQVLSNTDQLRYKGGPSAVLSNGEWKILSITGANITPANSGTPPAANSNTSILYATIPDHTAMSADTGKVTYSIAAQVDGKTISGILASQTFAKVKRTAIFRLINTEPISVSKSGAITQTVVYSQKIDAESTTNSFGAYITEQLDSAGPGSRTAIGSSGYTTTATATTRKVTIKLYASATSTEVLDTAEIKVLTDGKDGERNITITYSNDVHLVPTVPESLWTNSGGLIRVYEGPTLLTFAGTGSSAPASNGQYTLSTPFKPSSAGDNLTPGSYSPVSGGTEVTLGQFSGTLTQPTVYRITAYVRTSTGVTTQTSADASLVPTKDNVLYFLVANPPIITKTATTTGSTTTYSYLPATATFNLYRIIGNAAQELYTASSIQVDYSTDGTNYTTGQTFNSANTANYSLSSFTNTNIATIRARAYVNIAGATTLVDTEVLNAVLAGAKGDKGEPGIPNKDVVISYDSGTIKKTGTNYNPGSITLNLNSFNINTPSYVWSISAEGVFVVGGNPTQSNQSNSGTPVSVIVRPATNAITGFTVTVSVREQGTEIFQKNIAFTIYTDGIGSDGKRTATGYVYYNSASVNAPGGPGSTGTTYQFTTGTFSGLNTGWSTSAPEFVPSTTSTSNNYWASAYTAVEGNTNTTTGTGGSLTFQAPQKTIGFTGLVTFNSLTATGTTKIDGARIETGLITANRIDTKGLVISDASGNVIFGSGATWTNAQSYFPAEVKNSSLSLSAVAGNANSSGQITIKSGNTTVNTINVSSVGINSFAYLNKIDKNNAATYIDTAAIGSAFIGNIIASTNFDGWFEQSNNVATQNSSSTLLTGKILTDGTVGWAIGKNGKAVFNQISLRGYLAGGPADGQVRVGADIDGLGFNGITLNHTNNQNIFGKTQDGTVVLHLNWGGQGGQLGFNSGVPGSGTPGYLGIRGNITCDSITINNVSTTTGIATGQIGANAVTDGGGSSSFGLLATACTVAFTAPANCSLLLVWFNPGIYKADVTVSDGEGSSTSKFEGSASYNVVFGANYAGTVVPLGTRGLYLHPIVNPASGNYSITMNISRYGDFGTIVGLTAPTISYLILKR